MEPALDALLLSRCHKETVRNTVVETANGPSDDGSNAALPYEKLYAIVGWGVWKLTPMLTLICIVQHQSLVTVCARDAMHESSCTNSAVALTRVLHLAF